MRTEVIKSSEPGAIEKGAELIKRGEIVAFPTETVYGVGADAFNPSAVAKIFEVKNRPAFFPLIIHIAVKEEIYKIWKKVPDKVLQLIEKYWPGPLTIILPKKEEVPSITAGGMDKIGIRMPSNREAIELILKSQTPIAAPSANVSGKLSPTTAQHVYEQLNGKIPLIIDGGKCPLGIESTVIMFDENDRVYLIRPGALELEKIEKITGKLAPVEDYSTRKKYGKKLIISENLEEDIKKFEGKKIGLLLFKKPEKVYNINKIEILSDTGNLIEASSLFFEKLSALEKSDIDVIIAEKIPEEGLGRALMDRLKKYSG